MCIPWSAGAIILGSIIITFFVVVLYRHDAEHLSFGKRLQKQEDRMQKQEDRILNLESRLYNASFKPDGIYARVKKLEQKTKKSR